MKCCVEDCPDYHLAATENDLCAACEKELALAHLSDSLAGIEDSINAVEWQFCLATLSQFDRDNQDLHRVTLLFETLERTKNELQTMFGNTQLS